MPVLFGLVAWTAARLARAEDFDILQEEKFCPSGHPQARPVDNVTALVDSVKEKVDDDVVLGHCRERKRKNAVTGAIRKNRQTDK